MSDPASVAATPVVRLRPVEPGDYGPLRRLESDLTLGPRWRHRGATPSPEAFAQTLWSGVLAQYLVQSDVHPQPLGLVAAYGADLQSGTAWIAFARFPVDVHPALFVLGVRRFVDHLFATWPLRKLCAEVLDPNLAQFSSVIDRLFVQEGRHRDHAFVDGTYVDQHLFSLWREHWEAASATWGAEADASSLARFLVGVNGALDRTPDELDPDAPLLDQVLDSLDWVVLADHLEQLGLDPDAVTDALLTYVTLRALHQWAVGELAVASRITLDPV